MAPSIPTLGLKCSGTQRTRTVGPELVGLELPNDNQFRDYGEDLQQIRQGDSTIADSLSNRI